MNITLTPELIAAIDLVTTAAWDRAEELENFDDRTLADAVRKAVKLLIPYLSADQRTDRNNPQ